MLLLAAIGWDALFGGAPGFGILQQRALILALVLLCAILVLGRWVRTRQRQLALASASFAVSIVVAEAWLRCMGTSPGYIGKYVNFSPVEKLEVVPSFFTDDEGIFKANPSHPWPPGYVINEYGFRQVAAHVEGEFQRHSVLLIGDSFTWGASAEPISSSFADRISREGYYVTNLGIPGVSTSQYAQLAEKFVPALRPDVCVVVFYMGNDFSRQTLRPRENLFHVTNAGWLYAYAGKEHMTPEDAYCHYVEKSNVFRESEHPLGRILSRTVIGTYTVHLWRRVPKLAVPDQRSIGENERHQYDRETDERVVEVSRNLGRIERVCGMHQVLFLLAIIPVSPEIASESNSTQTHEVLIEQFGGRVPDTLAGGDYWGSEKQHHFNNSGHWKFSRFLIAEIETILINDLPEFNED